MIPTFGHIDQWIRINSQGNTHTHTHTHTHTESTDLGQGARNTQWGKMVSSIHGAENHWIYK